MASATVFSKAQEAASFLQGRLDPKLQKPKVAIVCGSGLGGLADAVHEHPRREIHYSLIPHFPQSTVQGHAGKLLFGFLGAQTPVVLMVGRLHYFEGHSIEDVTFPVRVLKLLGAETIILTNAAGGLHPEYAVGDITLLNDHIFLAGLAGQHPLRGPNADEFGVRFPPLSDAYDLSLRRCVHTAWQQITKSKTRRLHEGVYAYVSGPSYETRAECRMLRQLGADVVVLTPVPRGDDHLLQSSTTSHLADILNEGKANHEEVLEAGRLAAEDMQVSQTAFPRGLEIND
ncbi:Purine nucleoside phosphorylase [Talaromyces atroroseus]|uniref:Purine nucleoside phosphorylase n=1 Tax=Talaromyces atroroseus TaxID=1441469 RepID=A0A225AD96_TALAT|nr:Purine nucleoside phosphorylase [Talaromyces atroroseus]OKL56923.1 Purine nucleoside phosphorylase [Talaromyces atroroseus]